MDNLDENGLVNETDLNKLNQGLKAYKQIPSNDSDHFHYAHLYRSIKSQIKGQKQMQDFQNEQ